jgi:hypothetical protein
MQSCASDRHVDLEKVVGCETLVDTMNGDGSLFIGVAIMVIPNMRESPIGGCLKICAMEVQIAEPPGSSEPLLPCVEGGQTSYRSQIFDRVQQECSECEESPVGFSE